MSYKLKNFKWIIKNKYETYKWYLIKINLNEIIKYNLILNIFLYILYSKLVISVYNRRNEEKMKKENGKLKVFIIF